MQKFLCRGKKKSNGEWVTGYYLENAGKVYIVQVDTVLSKINILVEASEVITETVGADTGAADKVGCSVFVGDILESCYDEKYPEDFCYEQVLWDNNGFYMKQVGCSDLEYLDVSGCATYSKVVGNIYDNPELLEERDDG